MGAFFAAFPDRPGKFLGEIGAYIAAPGRNLADGGHQLLVGALFIDVAGRAGFQRAHAKFVFGMHAEHDDGELGLVTLDLLERFDPVLVRQRNVEQDEVISVLAQQPDGLCAGTGFGGHFYVRGFRNDLTQAVAHNCVVVDDKQTDHGLVARVEMVFALIPGAGARNQRRGKAFWLADRRVPACRPRMLPIYLWYRLGSRHVRACRGCRKSRSCACRACRCRAHRRSP